MKHISIILFFIFATFACDREEFSEIPYAQVFYDLSNEDMDHLLISPSFISITQPRYQTDKIGYGGLLVVHGIDIGPSFSYYAYDLSCPNEAKKNIRIKPDESGITATCSTCGAKFNIANGIGSPENNVTRYNLTRYNVIKLITGQYRVIN